MIFEAFLHLGMLKLPQNMKLPWFWSIFQKNAPKVKKKSKNQKFTRTSQQGHGWRRSRLRNLLSYAEYCSWSCLSFVELEILSFAHSARSNHRIRNFAQGRAESLSDDLNIPGWAQTPFLIDPGALQPPDLSSQDLIFSHFSAISDWLTTYFDIFPARAAGKI